MFLSFEQSQTVDMGQPITIPTETADMCQTKTETAGEPVYEHGMNEKTTCRSIMITLAIDIIACLIMIICISLGLSPILWGRYAHIHDGDYLKYLGCPSTHLRYCKIDQPVESTWDRQDPELYLGCVKKPELPSNITKQAKDEIYKQTIQTAKQYCRFATNSSLNSKLETVKTDYICTNNAEYNCTIVFYRDAKRIDPKYNEGYKHNYLPIAGPIYAIVVCISIICISLTFIIVCNVTCWLIVSNKKLIYERFVYQQQIEE